MFSLALRDKQKEFDGRGLPLRLRISEKGLPHGNLGITKSEANDATLSTVEQGWIHVAFTIEAGGGQIHLYKNGREIDAGPLVFGPTNFPHSRQPLVLGTYSGNKSTFFDGWMDEIAVFRRALHATEIRQMYEAGKPSVSK